MKKIKKQKNSEYSYLLLKEVEGADEDFKQMIDAIASGAKGLGNIAVQAIKTFNYSIVAALKIVTGQSLSDLNKSFNSELDRLNREFNSIMSKLSSGSKDASIFFSLLNPGAAISFLITDQQVTGDKGNKPTDFLQNIVPLIKPGVDLAQKIYGKIYFKLTGKEIDFDKLSNVEKKQLDVFRKLMDSLPEPAKNLIKNIEGKDSQEFIRALENYSNNKSEKNKNNLQKLLMIGEISSILLINNNKKILKEDKNKKNINIDSAIDGIENWLEKGGVKEFLRQILDYFKSKEVKIAQDDIEKFEDILFSIIKLYIGFSLKKILLLKQNKISVRQIHYLHDFKKNNAINEIQTIYKDANSLINEFKSKNTNKLNIEFSNDFFNKELKDLNDLKEEIIKSFKNLNSQEDANVMLDSIEEKLSNEIEKQKDESIKDEPKTESNFKEFEAFIENINEEKFLTLIEDSKRIETTFKTDVQDVISKFKIIIDQLYNDIDSSNVESDSKNNVKDNAKPDDGSSETKEQGDAGQESDTGSEEKAGA